MIWSLFMVFAIVGIVPNSIVRIGPMFNRKQFDETFSCFGVIPKPEVFAHLERLYRQEGRYYHTDQHVAECLVSLHRHLHLAEKPAEVELAIWFHDAIYDPRRSDNEEQSAELARQVMTSAGIVDASIARVERMIWATKSHQAQGRDTELMLDIDLEILGQPPEAFYSYDQAIRKEYAWVPEAQYSVRRASVLRSFLSRSYIYCTSDFWSAYETQARTNIEGRLKVLV